MGSISLAGALKSVSGQDERTLGLELAIGDVEVHTNEVSLVSDALLSLGLGLSPGVTEALLLVLYAPEQLKVRLTFTSGDNATFRVKGHSVLTLSPGGGLTALQAALVDPADGNRKLYYSVIAIPPNGETPAFWA